MPVDVYPPMDQTSDRSLDDLQMTELSAPGSSMAGILDQCAELMEGMESLLPANMDVSVNLNSAGDPQVFTPVAAHLANSQQQSTEIPRDSSTVIADSISGTGAGPLPTGFNVQSSPGGGSTLTEFTKRKNWPQRILEELRDFLHILTPDGRIIYVSPSAKALTGYEQEELVGKFIVDFIHADDSGTFVREFNESIASGNTLRFFYRFKKTDGKYAIFESHGHPHLTSDAAAFGPNNAAGFCRGFFMMARPYPTRNARLLDSFLEHKIENERLSRRIADLKREEKEDIESQQRQWSQKQQGQQSPLTPVAESDSLGSATPASNSSMPPPAKPPKSNTTLTRQNLDKANTTSKSDSINDKMARYEGATHIETIEMLTGLRYRDGERSQGISTGDTSPTLIRGDAGIAIPADKESRGGDKKKKIKVVDEYVCTDCGTLDSPEWRKGPNGPKTLCNACGLRWAKKEKKRHSHHNAPNPTTETPDHADSQTTTRQA
ncbi:MAG: blue light receptor [Trichoglossum hirsutum]|nr:MAG: blue light receptor [Trichoglossum hirsutum]